MTTSAPQATVAPACELADVFTRYGADYHRNHRLRHVQAKALRDVTRCRTAALGGHREFCDDCGYEHYRYHSCRNRHCPKCQSAQQAAWVEARESELLPVPYFHSVFTLPHDLNPLLLYSEANQRALLKLLFDAAAQTLLAFGRRNLGGKIGFTLVLHTWDQQLRPHFHLHGLIASGALADDGKRWLAGGRKFLFPVRALSRVFRAKYLDGLAALLDQGDLDVPPQLAALSCPNSRRQLLGRWRSKPWVVYAKAPFAGPKRLVRYLGRYTHRTAIANHRLVSCSGGQVRFRYRDRKDGDREKTATLPADQFIRRFLHHVLPSRFLRIRHYGLLANCVKKELLARCRALLGIRQPNAANTKAATQWLLELVGLDADKCPHCGGRLHREPLPDPKTATWRTPAQCDTS